MNPEDVWPRDIDGVDSIELESLLLEATALGHGHSTLRLTRHTFIVEAGASGPVGFQGTLSTGTSHAAVTACADPMRLRSRLALHKVPTQTESHGDASQYHCYLIAGEVFSVVRPVDGASWGREIYRSVTTRTLADEPQAVHPDVLALAQRAIAALPPTPHAVVTITCPAIEESAIGCAVVSIDATAALVDRDQPPEWSAFAASQIIDHATGGTRHRVGDDSDRLEVSMLISEVPDVPTTLRALETWSRTHDLTITVEPEQRGQPGQPGQPGTIRGTLSGSPGEVALLSTRLMAGALDDEPPGSVALETSGDQGALRM